LLGIALADMLVMVEYIPFIVHRNLLDQWTPGGRPRSEVMTWGWTVFVWFHSNFSVVIHNVSVWLTLSLAVWRFIMIRFHAKAPVLCTMRRCWMVILGAYGESLTDTGSAALQYLLGH